MINKNKRSITLIAVFLIVSFMSTLILSGLTVKASILGPKYYYLYLEKQNIKDIEKKCKDYYINQILNESSYECKANAKLSGDFLKDNDELKQISDILSKLEFNIKGDQNIKNLNNSYFLVYLGAKYNNENFVDMDVKLADKKEIIKFPTLTDKALGFDNNDLYNLSVKIMNAYTGDDKAFKELFGESRDDIDDLVSEYIKETIIDQIPDSKIELNKDANFKDIKCNSIAFNIDNEVVTNIYESLANKLEKDQKIRDICNSTINSFISSLEEFGDEIEKPTPEDIDEEIENICESLNEDIKDLEDVHVTYTAYYKNNGDIISRQLTDWESNISASLSTFKDTLGNEIFNLSVNEDENKTFELNNEKKLVKGNYDGECIIDISDKNLLKVNYTYEKNAKVGNLDAFVGNIQGKIDLNKLKYNRDDSIMDDTTIDDTSNNVYFSIDNKRKDNNSMQGKSEFTCEIDGKRVGITLYTDTKQFNKCNIAKPNVTLDNAVMFNDYKGMEEFSDELIESLQEKAITLLFSSNDTN